MSAGADELLAAIERLVREGNTFTISPGNVVIKDSEGRPSDMDSTITVQTSGPFGSRTFLGPGLSEVMTEMFLRVALGRLSP